MKIWQSNRFIIRHFYVRTFMVAVNARLCKTTQIAKFMGPTWSPPGSCRSQMGPMLAPWALLLRYFNSTSTKTCSRFALRCDQFYTYPSGFVQQHCTSHCRWNYPEVCGKNEPHESTTHWSFNRLTKIWQDLCIFYGIYSNIRDIKFRFTNRHSSSAS